MTVGAHYHGMLDASSDPESIRAGALVLRVWLEGTAGHPLLRIGLTGRQDITREIDDTASASTIEDALALVRDWLERFRAAAHDDLAR